MSLIAKLRKHLLTGIIVSAPIIITIYVAVWFVDSVDDIVKPLMPDLYSNLPFYIPGIGLLIVIILFTLLGAIVTNLFGYTFIRYGEKLVNRMPVFSSIYNLLKNIFETILSKDGTSFKEVGLIEFPHPGLYAVVFLASVVEGEIKASISPDEQLVSVFLPTAPNPTSGFLMFIPRKNIIILDMSVEHAARMVISIGIIPPSGSVVDAE